MLAKKGRSPREQIKKDCTKTVNISVWSEARSRPTRLFWRNITGCAENRERARQITRSIEPFCQTEVAHHRLATPIEENIARFEISMKNASAMCEFNGARDFHQKRDYSPCFSSKSLLVLDQATTRREFHAEKR